MDRKNYIISSFLRFIKEKYDAAEIGDEVIQEPCDTKDKKISKGKVKEDTLVEEEIPTNQELKKDLISLVEEYKMLFEK